MGTSTTGLKFQNKAGTTEFTLGATTISEQQRPGEIPTDKTLPGFSFTRKF